MPHITHQPQRIAAQEANMVQTPADLPKADDTITIGGRQVLRFHPTHKKIRDSIPRCISCGQVDEDGYHDFQFCPGSGGALPFPTSTIKINLKADSGYRCEMTSRLTLEQWVQINQILAGKTVAQVQA